MTLTVIGKSCHITKWVLQGAQFKREGPLGPQVDTGEPTNWCWNVFENDWGWRMLCDLIICHWGGEVRNGNVFFNRYLNLSSVLTSECDSSLNLIPKSMASPPGLHLSNPHWTTRWIRTPAHSSIKQVRVPKTWLLPPLVYSGLCHLFAFHFK